MSPTDKVRLYRLLNMFCGDKMLWEWVGMPQFEARVLNNKKRYCGFVKIVKKQSNFGTEPVVELPEETTGFLYELAKLCGVASAVIVKFRDRAAYVRLGSPDNRIPIGAFKIL